jgi:hypothetical protein
MLLFARGNYNMTLWDNNIENDQGLGHQNVGFNGAESWQCIDHLTVCNAGTIYNNFTFSINHLSNMQSPKEYLVCLNLGWCLMNSSGT